MNHSLTTEELDVTKLIEAVRGSQAAQVLFEYRCHRGEGDVREANPPGRAEHAHSARRNQFLNSNCSE